MENGKEKFSQDVLVNLIKEDREEIRVIKNRIYTYVQVLITLSIAVTAFFIQGSMDVNIKINHSADIHLTDSIKMIVIFTNVIFLFISWVIFLVLNKDLYFVRKCLTQRESELKEISEKYFGKKSYKTPNARFKNDLLLLFPMCILTIIYIVVIIGVQVFF